MISQWRGGVIHVSACDGTSAMNTEPKLQLMNYLISNNKRIVVCR